MATLLGGLLAQGVSGSVVRLHAQVRSTTSSVEGRIVDRLSGVGMEGATVALSSVDLGGPAGSVVSGEDGYFGFPEVPTGLYWIEVSLIGYTDVSDTLRVSSASAVQVTLSLSADPLPLDPMEVVVRRRPVGPLEDFERRRALARGVFLDREEIDARNVTAFTDLVRVLPGVRLIPTATGQNLFFRGGGCAPDLWLDGAQIGSTRNIDSYLHVDDLEAVEIYRGAEMPGEFGNNLCGAIVAWTKRGHAPGDENNDRSLERQLLFAGSFVVAILGFRWLIR